MARFKDRRLLLLFSAMMFLMVARAEIIDCDDSLFAYTLSCNQAVDPWIATRDTLDIISAGSAEACGKDLDEDVSNKVLRRENDEGGCEEDEDGEIVTLWIYSVDGIDEIKTVPDEELAENEELSEEDKKEQVEDISGKTAIAEPVKKVIKKLKKNSAATLKQGLTLLKKVSSVLMFAGPVLDLIVLFMPSGKSEELNAIESGFVQMGARLDAVSNKLENIEGATAYNAIINDLAQYESQVDNLIQKYDELGAQFEVVDMSLEMPSRIKTSLEDLVSAIKDGGNLDSKLNHVVRVFNGASELNNDGKTLIEIYMGVVNNDCSKILPLSSRLMKIVRDAQKLIYFYENNQQLCVPGDDKGYPKMIYDMYTTTTDQYIKCTTSALDNANKDMELRYGDGDSLSEIIDDLETKYILFNWATVKENNRQSDMILIRDHASIKSEVELTAVSDDEKTKQRLSLFSVTKSTKKQIQDASDRILNVINSLSYDNWNFIIDRDIPIMGWYQNTVMNSILRLLKEKDSVLESMITNQLISVVMFEETADISLKGWHLTTSIRVKPSSPVSYKGLESLTNITMGFLFSFEDTDEIKCNHGEKTYLSSFKILPYCVCDIGYGGDNCDIRLKSSISESDAMIDIVQKYKVPGMFDIQEDIKKSTNQIISQIKQNNAEIFKEVQNTRFSIKESENSILYAQSVMMDEIKTDNARFLREFDGLKDALDTAFEKERNERIYMSEKGNRLVVGTINTANELVTKKIASLTGKVIENRYFETLKFTVPVFEERFSLATNFGSYAMEDFVEYLRLHEFEFNSAKQAVENAILADSDSFIEAKMQMNMISGCTDTYTQQVIAAWQELFQLHLSLSTMETAVATFRINLSSNPEETEFLEYELEHLNDKITAVTDQFKKVYNERGCAEFSMPDLEGGGCKASTTYPGQEIMMTCSDRRKSLVVISTGTPITKIKCNTDSTWSVDVADLICASKCNYFGQIYDVGETRLLEPPEKGYKWENDLRESTCLLVLSTPEKGVQGDRYRCYDYTTEDRAWQQERWDQLEAPKDKPMCERHEGYIYAQGNNDLYWTEGCGGCHCCAFNGQEYIGSVGACRGGQPPPDGVKTLTMHNNRNCRAICDADVHCTGYVLPVGGSNWCETYTSTGSVGDGRRAFYCYMKDGVTSPHDVNWSNIAIVDINECLDDGFCGTGAESCSNTPGGFNCSCKPGFHVHAESKTGKCEDENECHSEAIGYASCLVREQLGSCENTASSYECSCFVGSYPVTEKECKACQCNADGITSQVCDNTGKCLCQDHVGGSDCSKCQEGYSNFPYCNQCENGYFGYPNCNKCDCVAEGVTPQICDQATGVCDCKLEGIGGSQCDSCKAYYTNYPLCEKDVVDGTLSSWGQWTSWTNLGRCGQYHDRSYQQRRTRKRTCDDSVKNIHGRSCLNDKMVDTETIDRDVCRSFEKLFIKLRDEYYAPTTGKVDAELKQGGVICRTGTDQSPTWAHPRNRKSKIYRNAVDHGCTMSFDTTRPIEMKIVVHSSNDLILTQFGIVLGDDNIVKYYSTDKVKIDENHNRVWYELIHTG